MSSFTVNVIEPVIIELLWLESLTSTKSNLKPSPPCPLTMPLNASPLEKRLRSTLGNSSDHPEVELPKGDYREGLFVRECGDRTNGNGFKFKEG